MKFTKNTSLRDQIKTCLGFPQTSKWLFKTNDLQLNIFEIAPNLSYLKLVWVGDGGWRGEAAYHSPAELGPLCWWKSFCGVIFSFQSELFLPSDRAWAVIKLAQVYSPLVRVRCWDYCRCYHPTCLLTSPLLRGPGWGRGEGAAPGLAAACWARNNQHNEDSFPRSPPLTGFPPNKLFGTIYLKSTKNESSSYQQSKTMGKMNRNNFTFNILPLCYNLGTPVLMACSGPLLETLDPIPCLPPPAPPARATRSLSDTNRANSCHYNGKIVSF